MQQLCTEHRFQSTILTKQSFTVNIEVMKSANSNTQQLNPHSEKLQHNNNPEIVKCPCKKKKKKKGFQILFNNNFHSYYSKNKKIKITINITYKGIIKEKQFIDHRT